MAGETLGARSGQGLADCEIETAEKRNWRTVGESKDIVWGMRPFRSQKIFLAILNCASLCGLCPLNCFEQCVVWWLSLCIHVFRVNLDHGPDLYDLTLLDSLSSPCQCLLASSNLNPCFIVFNEDHKVLVVQGHAHFYNFQMHWHHTLDIIHTDFK